MKHFSLHKINIIPAYYFRKKLKDTSNQMKIILLKIIIIIPIKLLIRRGMTLYFKRRKSPSQSKLLYGIWSISSKEEDVKKKI